MDKMRHFGALFDLDGVLIDSESTYSIFWSGIDEIYPTGIENYAMAIKGTTLPEILKHYDDEEVKADIVHRLVAFQQTMTYPLYPGVEDFLGQLRSHGIPAAIVTSSDNSKMNLLFEQQPQLRNYFDAIIDASQVTMSKPHPQGYLKAAEAIGCDPHDCFVFEDSLQGLKAGSASGATVIAIASTYPAEILKDKATKVIGGLNEFSVDKMLALSKP